MNATARETIGVWSMSVLLGASMLRVNDRRRAP